MSSGRARPLVCAVAVALVAVPAHGLVRSDAPNASQAKPALESTTARNVVLRQPVALPVPTRHSGLRLDEVSAIFAEDPDTRRTAPAVTAADRPDIVVVMVDDMGAIDERVWSRLPNIRSLFLDSGLRFDAAYSETPLCCPGRASLLTGQHTRRHGVWSNTDPTNLNESETVAPLFDAAGYWTVYSGKYLNKAEQLPDKTPLGWDRFGMVMMTKISGNAYSEWYVQDSFVIAGNADRYATDNAVEWLRAAPSTSPVMLWYAPYAPHRNMKRTEPWWAHVERRYRDDVRCARIPRWKPADYAYADAPSGWPLARICRSLLTVDDGVRQLRAELQAQGRDAIWLLVSDNGMSWGRKGYPLKNVPWADRVPLYVAGPGIRSGSSEALVSNIDVSPTLADLAGLAMPNADGRSFAEVLAGSDTHRESQYQDHPLGGNTRIAAGDKTGPWWSVRTDRWRLVEWGTTQLYDLSADPWEMQNVASEHPEKVQELEDMRP